MTNIKILKTDCMKGLAKLEDNSVDLIFADPPFNQGLDYNMYSDKLKFEHYLWWCKGWIRECFRVLKNTGSFYMMNSEPNIGYMQELMGEYGVFQNLIIWERPIPPNRYSLNRVHQDILFFTKTKSFYFNKECQFTPAPTGKHWVVTKKGTGKRLNDIWHDIKFVHAGAAISKEAVIARGTRRKVHPCQMPEKLISRILEMSTRPGELVLDVFAGSGTVAVACRREGRKYIGFEIDKKYIELTKRRLKDVR